MKFRMLYFPNERTKLKRTSNVSGHLHSVDRGTIFILLNLILFYGEMKHFYELHVGNAFVHKSEVESPPPTYTPWNLFEVKIYKPLSRN